MSSSFPQRRNLPFVPSLALFHLEERLEHDENLFKTTWRVIQTYIHIHRLHDDDNESVEESSEDGLLEAISQNMQLANNDAIIYENAVEVTTPAMDGWMNRLLTWCHEADHDISVAPRFSSHR